MTHCDLCITRGRSRVAIAHCPALGNLCGDHFRGALHPSNNFGAWPHTEVACLWNRPLTDADNALLIANDGDCWRAGIVCTRHG